MKAFKKVRFLLIDCGRVSKRTKGNSGPFGEAFPYPFNTFG
ncbi:MAG TPA: hypothetical protein VGM84_00365 [Steroidobacteraceae bacterium]|jgi:hypothetical protein